MSVPAPRGALHWIVLAITIALLGVFARGVDWRTTWAAVAHADPALLGVAGMANLATLMVKGVRWSLFLGAVGAPGVGPAIRATFAGAALNGLVVASGGDAARVALVARGTNVASARVLATLALDRLGDAATYVVMFVAAAFVLPVTHEIARWRVAGLLVLVAMTVATAALIARSGPREAPGTASPPTAVRGRIRRYWRDLAATLASIATARRMVASLALSLVAWGGQWATFHYAAAAVDFPITPAQSLVALLVVNASFLVRVTPGNVGVFQLLYVLAATSAGLDAAPALAVAFLIQAIQYIPVTFVGLLLAPPVARRRGRVGRVLERHPRPAEPGQT